MNTPWNKKTPTKQVSVLALLAVLPLATLGVRSLSEPTKTHRAAGVTRAGRTGRAAAPAAKAPAVQAPVQMHLAAARLQVTHDAQGRDQETWQPLADNAPVQSGDVLRYTLRIENPGPQAVRDFVVVQPIPPSLAYVPASEGTEGADGVQVTFHVDGETGYSAAPTVPEPQADGTVKRAPAPAEAYRAIRWSLTEPLIPGQPVQAVFGEKVL